jgi:hypothetical protein
MSSPPIVRRLINRRRNTTAGDIAYTPIHIPVFTSLTVAGRVPWSSVCPETPKVIWLAQTRPSPERRGSPHDPKPERQTLSPKESLSPPTAASTRDRQPFYLLR